jgi:hypothetical protein
LRWATSTDAFDQRRLPDAGLARHQDEPPPARNRAVDDRTHPGQ